MEQLSTTSLCSLHHWHWFSFQSRKSRGKLCFYHCHLQEFPVVHAEKPVIITLQIIKEAKILLLIWQAVSALWEAGSGLSDTSHSLYSSEKVVWSLCVLQICLYKTKLMLLTQKAAVRREVSTYLWYRTERTKREAEKRRRGLCSALLLNWISCYLQVIRGKHSSVCEWGERGEFL